MRRQETQAKVCKENWGRNEGRKMGETKTDEGQEVKAKAWDEGRIEKEE